MADDMSGAARLQMVNAQLRTSDITEREILAAFAAVPREAFVALGQRALAYADAEVAATGPAGRKLLSPRTLGLLLKSAAPLAGERALSVGGGSGYCAALLKALGLAVTALETDASAARAQLPDGVAHVDGPLTDPPGGAFDVIVVNGGFEDTPQRLIAALAPGGRLVGLRARSTAKKLVLFERSGDGISERILFDAAGDVLPGFCARAVFRILRRGRGVSQTCDMPANSSARRPGRGSLMVKIVLNMRRYEGTGSIRVVRRRRCGEVRHA